MLRVSVYSVDAFGRVDVIGYGSCRIPTQSGTQTRTIQCFRPVLCSEESGFAARLGTKFLGGAPRYADEQCVLSGDSRYAHLTQSTGSVQVQLTVVHAGFGENIHLDPLSIDAQQNANNSSMCFDCHTTKPLTIQQSNQLQALHDEMVRAQTRQLIAEADEKAHQQRQNINDQLRRADEQQHQQQQQQQLTDENQQQNEQIQQLQQQQPNSEAASNG
jgi:hypothetical protein